MSSTSFDSPRFSTRAWRSALWLVRAALSAAYLKGVGSVAIACAQIPFPDEGETVEFKSSLRWDYAKQRASKEVERSVIKTVIGFLN